MVHKVTKHLQYSYIHIYPVNCSLAGRKIIACDKYLLFSAHKSILPVVWFTGITYIRSLFLIYFLRLSILEVRLPRWRSDKESACQCRRQIRSQSQEDPLEQEMVTHSSILAWKIPRTEEPGGLWSMGSQRVRHD